MSADDLIGLDIGGTTLKAVRINARGTAQRRVTVPAGGRIPREALLATVKRTVMELDGGTAARHIGIALGGLVRSDGVMPNGATNLANLADVPLTPLFTERLDRPCTIVNDAQAAMHGEAWIGAARRLRDVLFVTFGTGIGSGLLLDGRVRKGAHGAAGELGAGRLGDPSGGSLEEIAAPVPFERRHRRPLADAILDSSCAAGQAALDAIGRSLAAAHLLLDLEAIVVGGGLVEQGEPLRCAIETAVRRNCRQEMHHGLVVRLSTLGPYAGAIGAVSPTLLGGRA